MWGLVVRIVTGIGKIVGKLGSRAKNVKKKTPSKRGCQTGCKPNKIDLLNPSSLRGRSAKELDEHLLKNGWTRSRAKSGYGDRYAHPANKGEQVRIMQGRATDPNPVKRGPYARISRNGEVSDPIPLAGNTVLK